MLKPKTRKIGRKKTFREIRYNEKRNAIIESAVKAFGQKGFHATTIEEITDELKLTKGSLYYYFATKEDLLYEAHTLSLKKVIDSIDRISKTQNSPDVKVKMAIVEHLDILSKGFEGAFMLQHEFHLPKESLDQVLAMRKHYEESFVEIIEEGIKTKVFRVKNAKLTAFILLGAINWFLRWYSSSKSWTIEEIADVYVDLLCNGLLTNRESK